MAKKPKRVTYHCLGIAVDIFALQSIQLLMERDVVRFKPAINWWRMSATFGNCVYVRWTDYKAEKKEHNFMPTHEWETLKSRESEMVIKNVYTYKYGMYSFISNVNG